jgi:hypothetical protein
MTPAANVVFLPYPVPVGDGWLRRCPPPPYPTERRERQPPWPRQAIPVRDERAVKEMIAQAKRMVSEQRARELLRELER